MKLYGEITVSSQHCKIILLDESNQVHEQWHLLHHDERTILTLLTPYSDSLQGLAICSFKQGQDLIQHLMNAGYRVYLANKPREQCQNLSPLGTRANTQEKMDGMLAHQLYLNVSRRTVIGNNLKQWRWPVRHAS